jgi:hypothetical protein
MAILRAMPLARAVGCCLAAASLLTGLDGAITAQEVGAAELKAAFLSNFAKFTEWPAATPAVGQPFQFCVIGDGSVAVALEQALSRQPARDTRKVTLIKLDGPLGRCQLVYAAGLDSRQMAQLIASVRGQPVFTVAENAHFAEAGGVAQLIEEGGRFRFAINADAAQRNHLSLHARLLSLAKLVKDGPDATR